MSSTLIGVRPLKDQVLVEIYDRGGQTIDLGNGKQILTLVDDSFENYRQPDLKHSGIRPRWATVIALSEEAEQDGLRLGDDVLCDTMKWSRGIGYQRDGFGSYMRFWRIGSEDILVVNQDDRDTRCKEFVKGMRKRLTDARKKWKVV